MRAVPRAWSPYPWETLEPLPRALARSRRGGARALRALLDPERLVPALAELVETEVSVKVKSGAARSHPDTLGASLSLTLGAGVGVTLCFEPELGVELLTRALRRPFRLSGPSALEDSLAGALGALGVEVARRAGCEAPRLGPREQPPGAFTELTLLVGGKPYRLLAALDSTAHAPPEPELDALGGLEIGLTIVAALSLAERSTLADFVAGNAWFPGAGWWLDPRLQGPVALAAPGSELGIRAELTEKGDLVLRGETVALTAEAGDPMESSDTKQQTLTQAVLDSPVVVRIELGTVSLTAREWAELGPGDIIEAGRRVAEPVVLRVAGREVARGELVNLEGELGVRIRELVSA